MFECVSLAACPWGPHSCNSYQIKGIFAIWKVQHLLTLDLCLFCVALALPQQDKTHFHRKHHSFLDMLRLNLDCSIIRREETDANGRVRSQRDESEANFSFILFCLMLMRLFFFTMSCIVPKNGQSSNGGSLLRSDCQITSCPISRILGIVTKCKLHSVTYTA